MERNCVFNVSFFWIALHVLLAQLSRSFACSLRCHWNANTMNDVKCKHKNARVERVWRKKMRRMITSPRSNFSAKRNFTLDSTFVNDIMSHPLPDWGWCRLCCWCCWRLLTLVRVHKHIRQPDKLNTFNFGGWKHLTFSRVNNERSSRCDWMERWCGVSPCTHREIELFKFCDAIKGRE